MRPNSAEAKHEDCELGSCDCSPTAKKAFRSSLWGIVRELGKYSIMGMTITSLLTTLIPEEAVPEYIGSSGTFAAGCHGNTSKMKGGQIKSRAFTERSENNGHNHGAYTGHDGPTMKG